MHSKRRLSYVIAVALNATGGLKLPPQWMRPNRSMISSDTMPSLPGAMSVSDSGAPSQLAPYVSLTRYVIAPTRFTPSTRSMSEMISLA